MKFGWVNLVVKFLCWGVLTLFVRHLYDLRFYSLLNLDFFFLIWFAFNVISSKLILIKKKLCSKNAPLVKYHIGPRFGIQVGSESGFSIFVGIRHGLLVFGSTVIFVGDCPIRVFDVWFAWNMHNLSYHQLFWWKISLNLTYDFEWSFHGQSYHWLHFSSLKFSYDCASSYVIVKFIFRYFLVYVLFSLFLLLI